MLVGACVLGVSQGFQFLRPKMGIWLKYKAAFFWTGCWSFFLIMDNRGNKGTEEESHAYWEPNLTWGSYADLLLSQFQDLHSVSRSLCQPEKSSMPIKKQCWKTCTLLCLRKVSVFCLTNKTGVGSQIDLDSNSETMCLSSSHLWPVFGSNWTKLSIKCLYHFLMKFQSHSKHQVIICIKWYHIIFTVYFT